MLDLRDDLRSVLEGPAADWLDQAAESVRSDRSRLPNLFPLLPRRLGLGHLRGEARRLAAVIVDLGSWRKCDAGALTLLTAGGEPDPAMLIDLFAHGDSEERTMVFKSLAALPITAATGRLLGEAQRTNQVNHFSAAVLDSNLLARTRDADRSASIGFGAEDFERMILKIAFLDLPLERLHDATRHASPELSRMLQGLATEREAAGRKVWFGTNTMIAAAPTDGTVARLIGDLECGVDDHRLAAALGLPGLGDPGLARYARERLPREDRPAIRVALQRAIEHLGGS